VRDRLAELAAQEADQSAAGCQLADIPIEVKTIEALHFECDVPIPKVPGWSPFPNSTTKLETTRRFEVEDLASYLGPQNLFALPKKV
jgi:hypothetical protein